MPTVSARKSLAAQEVNIYRQYKNRDERKYSLSIFFRKDFYFVLIRKIREKAFIDNHSAGSLGKTPQKQTVFEYEYPSPPIQANKTPLKNNTSYVRYPTTRSTSTAATIIDLDSTAYLSPPQAHDTPLLLMDDKHQKNSVFSKRLLAFADEHSHLYSKTIEKRRESKIHNFHQSIKSKREEIFYDNRGLMYIGGGRNKPNLGNLLSISLVHDPRLDKDPLQTTPPPSQEIFWIKTKTPNTHPVPSLTACKLLTLRSHHLNTISHEMKYNQANQIVKDTFLSRGINADLEFVNDNGFSVDIVYQNTMNSDDGAVMGCAMYILMRKYVWVEEVAVKSIWRGGGVGKVLVDRMKHIAKARGKSVLLYALEEAVGFYVKLGFVEAKSFATEEIKINPGLFLVWNP